MSSKRNESWPQPAPGLNGNAELDIRCKVSGVVLGTLNLYITEGHMAYMECLDTTIFKHPFYNVSWVVLNKKLNESLKTFEETEWTELPDWQHTRLRLLTSAMLHSLGCLKQDFPCLPSLQVAVGSARRLQHMARWYHEQTTKRLQLPTLHISKLNGNANWENFKYWLDACFDLRAAWATRVRKMEHDAELRAASEEVATIREDISRKLDLNRVWNWLDLQFAADKSISLNERNRWKRLFMRGDLEPEFWVLDDLEDLIMAVLTCCDTEHDIMPYIRRRFEAIKSLIQDFYTGFTLVRSNVSALQTNDHLTEQEEVMFGEYDKQAQSLVDLPPRPVATDFATKGLFYQAEAKWNILRIRWERLKQDKNPQLPTPDSDSSL